jgi:hypothetical protein
MNEYCVSKTTLIDNRVISLPAPKPAQEMNNRSDQSINPLYSRISNRSRTIQHMPAIGDDNDGGVRSHLPAALTSKDSSICDQNSYLGTKRRCVSLEESDGTDTENESKGSKRGRRGSECEDQKKTIPPPPAIKKLKVRRFASQAHAMVSDLSQSASKSNTVASWSDSGEMFIIKHKAKFAEELHNYFNTSKFESFTKQLNIYGFVKGGPGWEIINGVPKPMMMMRNTSGQDGENKPTRTCGVRYNKEYICFWHPCFQRDRQDLLGRVQPEYRKKPGSAKQTPLTATKRSGKEHTSCNVGGVDEDEPEPEPTTTVEYWQDQVHYLEDLVEQRREAIEETIKDLQLRQCQAIQEIAEEVQEQCSLRIEGDRGMARYDEVPACPPEDEAQEEAPDASNKSHLNDWYVCCMNPKHTPMQARIHASYKQVFDIAEPLVFEEYGLHDMLSAHFQFKGDRGPDDYLT